MKNFKNLFEFTNAFFLLLVIILTTYSLYLYMNLGKDSSTIVPNTNTDKKYLSEGELNIERNSLLKTPATSSEIIQIQFSKATSSVVSDTELQVTSKVKNEQPKEVFVAVNSGITFIDSSVSTYEDFEEPIIEVIEEGTIFFIDNDNSKFGISNNSVSPIIFRTNLETNYEINTKNITFSNLKVGDIVKVEGNGHNESNDYLASKVIITGIYQATLE